MMTSALCESLAAHGRRGRTIAIKVRLDDWTTITRARTIAEPTCEFETIAAVALRLLQENAPERPVRLLGVRVAGLAHRQAAAEGAERAAERPGAGGEWTSANAARPGDEDDSRAQMALPV